MYKIRCDVCGKWTIFSSEEIHHFKEVRFIFQRDDQIVGVKAHDVCTSCLRLSNRIYARKTEIEKRKKDVIMPLIEAWLANRPMPPDEISKDDFQVDPPEYDNFRFKLISRSYWQKLSKKDAEWFVMNYVNQYDSTELKERIRFHSRRVKHELGSSLWVDTYGELFRISDEVYLMKWESGSRGDYDD